MDIQRICPHVRLAIPSVIQPPFLISRRTLFDYEIIYVESGSMILWVDGKENICQSGDVLLLRPGQPHAIKSFENSIVSQPHIHFDMHFDSFSSKRTVSFQDMSTMTKEEKSWIGEDIFKDANWKGPYLCFTQMELFKQLFYKVIALQGEAEANPLAIRAHMLLLLDYLLSENFPQMLSRSTAKNNPLLPVREYIDHNHMHPLNLDMLAMQFHYSKYHLEKEFKKLTGQPVISYYHAKRVQTAMDLLQSGLSVTQTAQKLNFPSIYAFSRFFKCQTGLPPSHHSRPVPQSLD